MPAVTNKLAFGGRHHNIFRDSLVQRSLIVRGTAAIHRVEAEHINCDDLIVNGQNVFFRPPGMTLVVPKQQGSTDQVLTVTIKADTGINRLQGWSFRLFWIHQRCNLIRVQIGNNGALWENVTGFWTTPSGVQLGTPAFRVGETGAYSFLNNLSHLYPQRTQPPYPSVQFTCTQNSITDFNKNKSSVLIATLTFLTNVSPYITEWAGTEQCIHSAFSQGFTDDEARGYDADVMHPVYYSNRILAGNQLWAYPPYNTPYTWAYGLYPSNWIAHNRIPIEDSRYVGVTLFDGYFQNNWSVGSASSKLFPDRVESPNVILSTASGDIASVGNTNYAVSGGQVYMAIQAYVTTLEDRLAALEGRLANDGLFLGNYRLNIVDGELCVFRDDEKVLSLV